VLEGEVRVKCLRVVGFALVLFASLALGGFWTIDSNTDLPAVRGTPPVFDVFTQDPSQDITLRVFVSPAGDHYRAQLAVTSASVDKPLGTLLFVSTIPGGDRSGLPQFYRDDSQALAGIGTIYASVQTIGVPPPDHNDAIGVGAFDLPAGLVNGDEDKINFAGVGVGGLIRSELPVPVFGTVSSAVSDHESLVIRPKAAPGKVSDPLDAASYLSPSGQPLHRAYFVARHLTAEVQLTPGKVDVADVDIRRNEPSTAVIDGSIVTWTAPDFVFPSFAAVSHSLEDSAHREEFLSGVAFATGAAALVALLQELPEEGKVSLSIRRRRRRRGNDRVPHPEAADKTESFGKRPSPMSISPVSSMRRQRRLARSIADRNRCSSDRTSEDHSPDSETTTRYDRCRNYNVCAPPGTAFQPWQRLTFDVWIGSALRIAPNRASSTSGGADRNHCHMSGAVPDCPTEPPSHVRCGRPKYNNGWASHKRDARPAHRLRVSIGIDPAGTPTISRRKLTCSTLTASRCRRRASEPRTAGR